MSEFRDKADEIRQLGASLFGVSVESDRAHRAYAEHLGLNFPLLSDFNRELVGQLGIQYGEWNGMRGMSKRAAIVIGQDQAIRYFWVTDDSSQKPDPNEVIKALQEIRSSGR